MTHECYRRPEYRRYVSKGAREGREALADQLDSLAARDTLGVCGEPADLALVIALLRVRPRQMSAAEEALLRLGDVPALRPAGDAQHDPDDWLRFKLGSGLALALLHSHDEASQLKPLREAVAAAASAARELAAARQVEPEHVLDVWWP